MPYEHDPKRLPAKAPRGCLVAFVVAVGLLVLLLVVVELVFQPRFPDADPF